MKIIILNYISFHRFQGISPRSNQKPNKIYVGVVFLWNEYFVRNFGLRRSERNEFEISF